MGNLRSGQISSSLSQPHYAFLFDAVGKEAVHGVLYFRRDGRASVHVEGKNEPIPLAKGASGTALHGDEVRLRRLSQKSRKGSRKKNFGRKPSKPRYEVVKIQKRGTDEFLGYLQKIGQRRIPCLLQ